jgi:hypothetical protein
VQELRNVPVKQTLLLVEKTTIDIARRGDTDFEVKITGPRQQRYLLESSVDLIGLHGWFPMTPLTITNADGTVTFQGVLDSTEPALFFRAVPLLP